MPAKSIWLFILCNFILKLTGSFAHLSQAAADFSELALCTLVARKAWTTRKLPAALACLQGTWLRNRESQRLLCEVLSPSYPFIWRAVGARYIYLNERLS